MGGFGISIDTTCLGRSAAENGEKEGQDGEAADDQARRLRSGKRRSSGSSTTG
ncbi:hypothetical protein [Paenibacillus sp.]|uniref:hypothetical protein n=1 Tax=Paenibacillus sp. TaxID=58172 RepID=UPI002810ED88|nr:hypothetical protein [Paenibacillus sp.]